MDEITDDGRRTTDAVEQAVEQAEQVVAESESTVEQPTKASAETGQGSTVQRDIGWLIVLAILLYGLVQLTGLDVRGSLTEVIRPNSYVITNNCALPLVISSTTEEVARVESGETMTVEPPLEGSMALEVAGTEKVRFRLLSLPTSIELAGDVFPASNEIYGVNIRGVDEQLIACPS